MNSVQVASGAMLQASVTAHHKANPPSIAIATTARRGAASRSDPVHSTPAATTAASAAASVCTRAPALSPAAPWS